MLIMVTVSDFLIQYVIGKANTGFKQLVEALRLDFERHFYMIKLKGKFLS